MRLLSKIIKRNGQTVTFEKTRILKAIEKAFLSENNTDLATVATLCESVVNTLISKFGHTDTISVETVQDTVEELLMHNGHLSIAKNYILYREKHKQKREYEILEKIKDKALTIKIDEDKTKIFNPNDITKKLKAFTQDLNLIDIKGINVSVNKQIYDGISQKDIDLLLISAVRERIERHTQYSLLSARLLLNGLYESILGIDMSHANFSKCYKEAFHAYIHKGISLDMLNPDLAGFDLEKLSTAIDTQRDNLLHYLGAQILVDRYLLRDRTLDRQIYELPQWFWMRVAMGLSLKEQDKTQAAIDFYTILSNMDLVSSTPTLFNSGTNHSQMSSCYINIVDDSLEGIFKQYGDNAQLSKWAGGIGTDWTPVRATGSKIHGTNGSSQGVIPFIKIFNDVALAVNQGGKRKGAMCAYMEVWHLDYEQFIELKKNTGDERRRAHDINTASWIPDLFMKRVKSNDKWTLFCPSDVPELHDLYGADFEKKYIEYEQQNLATAKTIQASDLWRKMLTMLFETGHPWLTFKDPINVRNPQNHVGVVHSSNLCTEITLNTSKEETAVCNLASLNLSKMIKNGALDREKIAHTIRIGIRMLDNVIDNNFYPTKEAQTANLRHRAIGLGLMGYQDALYKLNISYDSIENLNFADESMELISYYAIQASAELAEERGSYETFKGSKWERGLLPIDTLKLLEEERGEPLRINQTQRLDWGTLREKVKKGMRNCNTMAIAPTATIANITGVYPCTEPAFKNLYMKENLSGNFVVINHSLIADLERKELWTPEMLTRIKLNNGSLKNITEIPQNIRDKYKETFEIAPHWVIKASALRGKWIDQSASTNVFINTTSGKLLSDTYMTAWESGLKTTYYLRSLSATQVSKTVASSEPRKKDLPNSTATPIISASDVQICTLNDPSCEACQ